MARKPIANDDKSSYYEGIFGKGEGAKMYFAFKMIPIFFFAMCGAIVLAWLGCYLTNIYSDLRIEFLSVLGVVVPIFSAPLTFMLGYLYGKPIEK